MYKQSNDNDISSFVPMFESSVLNNNQNNAQKLETTIGQFNATSQRSPSNEPPVKQADCNKIDANVAKFNKVSSDSLTCIGRQFIEDFGIKNQKDLKGKENLQNCLKNATNQFNEKLEQLVTHSLDQRRRLFEEKFEHIEQLLENLEKQEQELAVITNEIEKLFTFLSR